MRWRRRRDVWWAALAESSADASVAPRQFDAEPNGRCASDDGHAMMGVATVNTATLAKKDSVGARRAARALLLPGGALHQSGNHHRPATAAPASSIPMADSITTWRMAMMASTTHGALGSGTVEPEGLPGFLRRSRPAGHAHAGRPRLDSGGCLQLLGRARRREPATAAGRLVLAGGRRRREEPSRWIPAAWAARSSRSKPSASASSS